MRNIPSFVITVGLAALVLNLSGCGDERREGAIDAIVRSEILAQERELIIHLPRNHDTTRTYPVVYVLDGSSQDDHIADEFERLSAAGAAPQAIVVGIPNMSAENRVRNLTPPLLRTDVEKPDSPVGEGDVFLSFMESELFPFIERRYKTSHTRLFVGHSRGALLVMYSLLFRPDMFSARFCFSGPFWRQDHLLTSKVAELLTSADTLRTFVYLSAGDQETERIKGGLESMRAVFQKNAVPGLVWHTDLTPGADHEHNPTFSAAAAIGTWNDFVKN